MLILDLILYRPLNYICLESLAERASTIRFSGFLTTVKW